jgi:hypothetical protein
MNQEEEHAALAERYTRLAHAARLVVDGARALGDPEHPMCGVPPYLIKRLRRELPDRYEPQPSTSWFTMSVDS